MTLTKEQSNKLLHFAREAIAYYLSKEEYLKVKEPEPWMLENRATFVTLKIKNNLRGCIGHLHAIQDVHKDIIDNAVAAAFLDPRFPGLKKEELDKIHIEISVISNPEKLVFSGKEDLLNKLNSKQGVCLIEKSNGLVLSTFLPQVWKELPDKKEFLSQLCIKAGLSSDYWEKHIDKLLVEVYAVEVYEEK